MMDAIRSEWIKLRSARSNLVLLILAVLVPIGLTLLVASTVPDDELTATDRFNLLMVGAAIGYVLIGVLGVLVVGQEYRHNTIRVTFTADPHRVRVMTAKAIVVAGTGLVAGAIATIFSYVLGNAILSTRDLTIEVAGSTQARALVGSVLLFALDGLVGLGLGAIIRATAGAITLLIVWPIIVENVIRGFFPGFGKWLPFAAGGQLTSIGTVGEGSSDSLSWTTGGFVFLVFALAMVVIGTVLVARRDA